MVKILSTTFSHYLVNLYSELDSLFFFILSGYFILNSRVDFTASSFFKRIKKIAIPFIFYSIAHWFIINKGMTVSFSGVAEYINALTVRNSISIHFWFVYSLIGIYIFAQPINYLLKDISINGSFFGLIIIAFLFLYNGDLPSIGNVLPVSSVDKWTAYFVAGGFLARIKDKISINQAIILTLIGYTSIVFISVYNSKNNHPMPYDFSISMFVACCGVVLLFSKLHIKNSKLLSNLSESTYGAYLIHICILKLLSPFYFTHIHKPGVINYFFTTFILAVFVFTVSITISLMLLPIFKNRYLK